MRALPLFCCICASLCAQIRDLATTGDGSQLYFSAPYRLTGSGETGYQKLFRYAGGRFEVFRRFNPEDLYGGPYHDTNFYLAERPQVSADGSVVGYTVSRNCLGGSHCVAYTLHEAYLAGSPDTTPGAGWLTLSPDGRYALVFVTEAPYPGPNPALLDLVANTSVNLAQVESAIGDGLQAVASGGAALLHDANGALIRSANGSIRLALTATPRQARLSADASTVVYEMASTGGEWQLRAYDVAGARDRLLASAAAPPYPTAFFSVFHPVVTRDGKTVAYLAGGQAVVQGTDGSAPQRLTDAPEGIAALTISGSGNVVYAATATSRLLRIDLPGGLLTELSAAVPHLEIVWGAVVPGARLDAAISNAPAAAMPVLNVSGGSTAPAVAHAGAITSFQVPWEAAEGGSVVLTATGNPSPLEEVRQVTVSLSSPVFYVAPTPPNTYPPYALGAREDFRRLLSAAAPAFAGGVVHLYATGLGAVSPPLATGAVTPTGTLYRAQAPLSCTVGAQPAEVLFAGLAPGGIGVNQIDLRVPPGLAGWQAVICGSAWGQIPVGVRQAPPHR